MAVRRIEQFYSSVPYAEPEFVVRENSGGRLPRVERPLTYVQRYIAKELGRLEPRSSGWSIGSVVGEITGRSRIGRFR